MNKQETFDTVVRHLKTQGKQSVEITLSGSHRCLYRGENGLKCAIGVLIPDDQYSSKMEGSQACNEKVAPILTSQGIDIGLASSLQSVHDAEQNWKYPTRMRDSLLVTAFAFMLNPAIVDELFPVSEITK